LRHLPSGPCIHANLGGHDLGVVRIAGPGLGNMLFPWARALLASRDLGIPMLSPTWPQLKIGSLLRGERDTRFYLRSFVSRPEEITGLNRFRRLFFSRRIPEASHAQTTRMEPVVRSFEGIGNFFHDLEHGRDAIAREIPGILSPRLRGRLVATQDPLFLGVHIRMGDFSRNTDANAYDGRTNSTIPLDWYAAQIERFGSRLGRQIILFSDGKDEELSDLLSLPGVVRAENRSAIEDILAMSQAEMLITSHSTFGYWGVFLGNGKAVSHPAVNLGRYFSPAFIEARFVEAA